MFQIHGSIKGLRHLGSSVAFAASLLMVTACVSTTASKTTPEDASEETAQGDVAAQPEGAAETQAAYRDPQVAAVGGAPQEAGYPTQATPNGQPGPIVMQATSL